MAIQLPNDPDVNETILKADKMDKMRMETRSGTD